MALSKFHSALRQRTSAPLKPSAAVVGDDATASDMAEALRAFPDLMIFAQLDAASVARRLLFAAGFDEDDIDRLWRAALEAELACRLAETALTSLTPVHHSEALDDDALISRMAQALRPFRNIDIDGFARLALLRSGFDRPATDRHWRAA